MSTTTETIRKDVQPRRLTRFSSAFASVLAVCGLVAAAALAQTAPQTAPGDPLDPRTYAATDYFFWKAKGSGQDESDASDERGRGGRTPPRLRRDA